MKKCLFSTLPSNDFGLLTRALPIAKELEKLGHQVIFCNPAKSPGLLIKEAGFDNRIPEEPFFRLITSGSSFKNLSKLLFTKNVFRNMRNIFKFLRAHKKYSTDEIWTLDHFMVFFGMLEEEFIHINVEAYIELIKNTEVEIVIDFWNPFACIAARVLDVPLISVIQADGHPQSKGFIWWKEKPNNLPSPINSINQVLSKYDLFPIEQTGELFLGNQTLVVGIPKLDPLPQSAEVTYIGPILWEKDHAILPNWIQELNNDLPIIWLYPGNLQYSRRSKTAFDSQIVLDACISAFDNQEMHVVLTTGHHELPAKYQKLPTNFQHASYIPAGLALAKKCDLLVHHGGYGSSQTGLFTGTPALVIPTFSERESNARRIASAKAGDYVLPTSDSRGVGKKVDPSTVRQRALNILGDPTYLENARIIQKTLESYGGASEAAGIIDNFLS
ncbi:MAG: nucleotide disphospho-sugar-binding domain-containing protein [Candidatus Kariarchaeaceae archaeon]|jgi:UDP:flavonoid glycosyltransferase YjiC (YdhE family)